jgi:hypothetical protein
LKTVFRPEPVEDQAPVFAQRPDERIRNGCHIGSGHVEAAVRVLVVRRTKQAGMHWRLANAVRMAAIHARHRSRPEAA